MKEKPTVEELQNWFKRSDETLRKFFNTNGKKYRELKLKDRLPELTEAEQIEILATDGLLVKRPLLVGANKVLIGFKEEEWSDQLL